MDEATAEIYKAIDILKRAVCEDSAQNTILAETAFSEAVLVGTRDAYLLLAISLLRLICDPHSGELPPIDGVGIDSDLGRQYRYTNSIKKAFSEYGDVWFVAAYLAETSEDEKSLISALRHE